MLIDTRDRAEPVDRRKAIEPDWRLWMLVLACIVLFLAAGSVTGPAAPLLALLGFTAGLLALERFTGRYGRGLQEWRQ